MIAQDTKEKIRGIIKDSLEELKREGEIEFDTLLDIGLEHPSDMRFGDYATNIALILEQTAKRNPDEVARLIVGKIQSSKLGGKAAPADDVQIVNGFINFFIPKEDLAEELFIILGTKEDYGGGVSKGKKKILIEYSSPNIAKSFGIGHLRSTIIGQAIYNLYKFLGWESIGVNHLGDWGTPHGKIIYQVKEQKLKGKSKEEAEKILNDLTIEELENLYVAFYKEAKDNPKMEEEARNWFVKLEEGDKEARNIWEHTREVSLREFENIYRLLDVDIDNVLGESFYQDMLADIVKECKDKKIARKSEGAWIVEYVKDDLPPAMLLKSDGATTYFTRDLAAIKYRLGKFKPDVLVYETGVEQTLHFQQVFAAAYLLGWVKDEKLVHVAHGLYRWEHGKLSTRRGDTIHLEEVLNEAISRAKNIIEESETARGLSEPEKEEVAKAVGMGGVKYNDLSHNPQGDIVFDWDKILNLKGNSAPYIQYTYARCHSILEKGASLEISKVDYSDFTEEELDILRFIYRFPEVVEEAAEKFSPNLLCSFVFDLSGKFNLFYANQPVLNAPTPQAMDFRLVLTEAVAQVIHNSLSLLGIHTPDKM